MFCELHEYEEIIGQCSRCGVDMCKRCNTAERGKPFVCENCGEDLKIRNRRIRHFSLVFIVLAGFAMVSEHGFDIFNRGTYTDTDSAQFRMDECIAAFEDVGDLLADGNLPSDDMICPSDSGAFIIEESADAIIVRHPAPEKLGYTEVYVSSKDPNPVLKP